MKASRARAISRYDRWRQRKRDILFTDYPIEHF
jgi:hypothetical protein